MTAWAHSGHPNAGKRCTWWLRKLWHDAELESDPNLLPTTQTYNITMIGLAASDGALAAENLLLDLGDKYKQEEAKRLCPNSESFAIVIRSWIQNAEHATHPEERVSSLERAVEWLSSLQEVENENNLSTAPELYTRILNTAKRCAHGRPAILQLATGIFRDLETSKYQMPYWSYSRYLEVALEALCNQEQEEQRITFVHELLSECREAGLYSGSFIRALVNSRVYRHSWAAAELQRFKNELSQSWPVPLSWTRNLPSAVYLPKKEDLKPNARYRMSEKGRGGEQPR